MDYLQDFFNYGDAFIVGNILLALAISGTVMEKKTNLKTITRVVFVIGSLLIVFSSVPVSNIIFRIQIILIIFLMITLSFGSGTLIPARMLLRTFVIAICYFSITNHFKSQVLPQLQRDVKKSVFVLGSPLSSSNESWITILEKKMGNETINLTTSDSTILSAMEQSELIPSNNSLIIMLLGMEELDRGSDPKVFGEELRALLRELTRGNNTVVMFELPTSIFQKHYLKMQREQCILYGIHLIPRNELFFVLDKHRLPTAGHEVSQEGHAGLAHTLSTVMSLKSNSR